MQTQDVPSEFLFKLWPWLEANKSRLVGGAVAIVVIAGVYYFINSQAQQKEIIAGQALTQLLVTPAAAADAAQQAGSLAQLAVKYAGTLAGQRAQLQAAADYFDLGKYEEAQAQFQKYLAASSSGPLLTTAELGLGASLEAQDKLAEAAAAYQKAITTSAGAPSALPAEFALGRIAEKQGKLAEAETHFETVARAGNMAGSLSQDAAMHYSEIKARLTSEQKTNAPAKSAMSPESVPFKISK
ncbi:MAG TPA: tetratricopeptide repeat protein [Verrucomicrobiae bacterium]